MKHQEKALLSWHAPEFLRFEKGKVWNIAAISLVSIVSILGFIFGAWSFSLAIIAFAVAYYFVHQDEPKGIVVSIHSNGLTVGGRNYPYSKIKNFWILYEPPFVKKLIIHVHGDFLREIEIQLHEQDPAEVRQLLKEHIPELKGQKERLTDIFARALKI